LQASSLMRGICEVTIGLVLILQHSFVKGGWHLLKAYGALRHLKIPELLEWDGMERGLVRSLAQYFLGCKALVLDGIPPSLTRWLPGFVGTGSRERGLEMLRQCIAEGQFFKPLAMDALLGYYVAKEVWVETYTPDEWREIDETLAEAEATYGRTSSMFGHKAAILLGYRRNAPAAAARVREIAADPNLAGLPAAVSAHLMTESNYLLGAPLALAFALAFALASPRMSPRVCHPPLSPCTWPWTAAQRIPQTASL
jgi:hypothetical protein